MWLTLGGRLTYTLAPDDGKVSGKAFDFFTACVKPLLGNETPVAGFADLIDRMRGKTDRELIANSALGPSARPVYAPLARKILFRSDGDGNA